MKSGFEVYILNRIPGRDSRTSLIIQIIEDIAKEYPEPDWPNTAPELIPIIKY